VAIDRGGVRHLLVAESSDLDELADALRALGHEVTRGRADDPEASRGIDAVVSGAARADGVPVTTRRQREMFIGMAVHDLKNPLATIVGNAEYLDQAPELSPDSRDSVHDLRASATLLGRVVLELADAGRGLDGPLVPTLAPVEMGTLMNDVLRGALPRAIRREVALILDTDLDPTPELLDRDLVRRVIETLLDNALKHAPAGSAVTLRARTRPRTIRIDIHDDGPEIPVDELGRIFDRAAVFDPGTGGLAMRAVRRLAALFCLLVCEAHGGRVWVECPASGGSTFCLELPR
jgi:signal transduction histidine kinase